MIHRLSHLTFTEGISVVITGHTFHIRQQLKGLGGRWAGNAWSIPYFSNTEENRIALNAAAAQAHAAEKLVNKAARAFTSSPAAKALLASENLRRALKDGWACCENATVTDVPRKHCACMTHGFHVRGGLFTGD